MKQARGGIHASAGTERRLLTTSSVTAPATADILKAKSPGVPTTLLGAQEPKTTKTQPPIPLKADPSSPVPNTSGQAVQPYSPTEPKPFNNGTTAKARSGKTDFEAEKERLRLKGRANKQLKEKLRLDLGKLQSATVKWCGLDTDDGTTTNKSILSL